MDEDLLALDRAQLIAEVARLRRATRVSVSPASSSAGRQFFRAK